MKDSRPNLQNIPIKSPEGRRIREQLFPMTLFEANWYVQVAAVEWLKEHPEDPNTPSVRRALEVLRQSAW